MPQNLPIGNQIIAGVTLGTALVEGAPYRGSLITARLAMEFAREVSSVPANATEPSHFGPKQLTKQGTQLATDREDVWKGCRPQSVPSSGLSSELSSAERATQGEQDRAPTERPVCELLSIYESRQVDELGSFPG